MELETLPPFCAALSLSLALPSDTPLLYFSKQTTNPTRAFQRQVDSLMEWVSETNGLTFGSDVKLLNVGSADSTLDYLIRHDNQTKVLINFCEDELDIPSLNLTVPCRSEHGKHEYFYQILYNSTLFQLGSLVDTLIPYDKDENLLFLKNSLDEAIMIKHGGDSFVHAKLQNFPSSVSHLNSIDLTTFIGPFLHIFPFLLLFNYFMTSLIKEKELQLRRVSA